MGTGYSTQELQQRRTAQELHMPLQAIHMQHQSTINAIGEQQLTYLDGLTYACGIQPTTNTEVQTEAGQLVRADSIARLPLSVLGVVHGADRLRVEEAYGEALAEPMVYEVIGHVQQGQGTAILVPLRRVNHADA